MQSAPQPQLAPQLQPPSAEQQPGMMSEVEVGVRKWSGSEKGLGRASADEAEGEL